jgi:hypothetical protein
MSQHCDSKSIEIYSNYLEYKKSFNLNNTQMNLNKLDGTFGIKQKAEVEGFMKNEISLI